TPVAANDDWGAWPSWLSRVSFPVHAGLEYVIAVDVSSGKPGTFALSWNVGPVNDDFEAPTILTGTSGSVEGTNAYSTWEGTDGGDISDRDYSNGNVWYRWQAQTTGPVTFRVRGSAPSPDLDVGVGPTLALVTWLDANRVEEDPNT